MYGLRIASDLHLQAEKKELVRFWHYRYVATAADSTLQRYTIEKESATPHMLFLFLRSLRSEERRIVFRAF